jgi:hypothetical protein
VYAAELRKRSLSGDANASAAEDVVTAGVLGALDYLPEEIAADAVQRLLGVAGFRPPVRFWRSKVTTLRGILAEPVATEPDAVLEGDGWVAVVEAKCGAPFGREQLPRELDLLLQEMEGLQLTTGLLVLLLDNVYAAGAGFVGDAQETYGGNTKTTTYTTWNAEGGLEQLDYAGGFSAAGRIKKTTFGNTTHTDYAYEGFRQATEIHHKTSGGTQFAGFDYDYDPNGNPEYEKRSHQSGHGDVYRYDKLDRLTKVLVDCVDPAAEIASPGSQSYTTKTEYGLDGVQNISSVGTTPYGGSTTTTSFTINALNQYVPVSPATTPTYDANGNLKDDGSRRPRPEFRRFLGL